MCRFDLAVKNRFGIGLSIMALSYFDAWPDFYELDCGSSGKLGHVTIPERELN